MESASNNEIICLKQHVTLTMTFSLCAELAVDVTDAVLWGLVGWDCPVDAFFLIGTVWDTTCLSLTRHQ